MSISQTSFFNDKFTPTPLPKLCAPRRKLLNVFHKAALSRLVFVSAPAGFGKTVSTLLWLSNSGRETVWIEFDAYDNVPSTFYKLFCTGVLSAQPDNEIMWKIRRSPSFSSSPVEHTIGLLSEFAPDDRSYALALDDMHSITNEEILKSLPFVLRRLPPSFVTLFLSRSDPMGEYAELAESGKAATIAVDHLLFSEDEISDYFGVLGRTLTTDETESIFQLTGGWAIGVDALAKSGEIHLEQNGGQILDNYIKKQFWDHYDKDSRDFMLKTSIVDEMSVELCYQLTGREDAETVLDVLCAENSFVRRFGGGIYRYHHLFLDFLRGQMQEGKISEKELHKLAADYYIETREIHIARRHAIQSENLEVIKLVTFKHLRYFSLPIDRYVNYIKIFNRDSSPDSICNQYPFLCMTYVWFYYVCGEAEKMEYYLDKMYQSLPVIAEDFPQFYETCLMEKCLDHRISVSEYARQLPVVTQLHDNVHGHFLTLQMPFMHRGIRDFYELADDRQMERFKQAFHIFLQEKADIFFACVASGLLLEQDRLEEALEKALLARSLVTEKVAPEIIFTVYIHHAAVLFAMGNTEKLGEILTLTEDYIEKSGAHYLRPDFIAYKTKIRLMSGGKAFASSWLKNYFVTETEHLELYKMFQHFTTVRAYIMLSQTDKAMTYILKLKKLGADFRRPLDIAEAGVLQAILAWGLGKKTEAQLTLESVLHDLQPYGFVRVVAYEGAAVLPILKKIVSKAERADKPGPLDKKYLNKIYLAAYVQSKHRKGLVAMMNDKSARLSKQQTLMIELLSQGYKNADIIKKTGLTINTVKAHTRIAYEKLGVNNAADAVLKARESGIIG